MVRWVFLSAFFAVIFWGDPAASTVKHLTCDSPMGCNVRELVGKSETKEFRTYRNTDGVKIGAHDATCKGGSNDLSCTATFCQDLSYCTCSCTNWSPTDRHHAQIDIHC